MIEYVIVILIVVAVLIWQLQSYLRISQSVDSIKFLFPDNDGNYYVVQNQNEQVTNIGCNGSQGSLKNTIEDINKYLSKNKNKTFDYQIIKEIVERNAQSLEEEVDTMLSTPLYLGLMATVLGIICGVLIFALNISNFIDGQTGKIQVLLINVGIAMIASFCGVLFTKLSTQNYNDARTEMDKNKNIFLTWIQAELMPKSNDSLSGVLTMMVNNLSSFNTTFSQNTSELKDTLGVVNENHKDQIELLRALKGLNISKIATANIQVYEKLKGCTDEIEKMATMLSNSEEYLSKVIQLNDNISDIDERTRLFENLGTYFRDEMEYVRDRQGQVRQHIASLDSVFQDALSDLSDSLQNSTNQLTVAFQGQIQRIRELINDQQEALTSTLQKQQEAVNQQISQMDNPFHGIKEMFENGLQDLTAAFDAQNKAIEEGLKQQTQMMETALKEQRETLLQKLKEESAASIGQSPTQMLLEIAQTLNTICEKLDTKKEHRWFTFRSKKDNEEE